MARHARVRGYTAIEVLIAMTVMAIGAAAVISMQRASVQGNLDARKADIANSIARTWVERLEHDAMQWTHPGPDFPNDNNIAVAQILNAGVGNLNAWFAPDQYLATGLSSGFDILGRDLPQTAAALFCVNVRMNWLTDAKDLIRADVRVLWARGITSNVGPCSQTGLARPDPTLYHAIYVTTSIRGNPQ